VAAFGTGSRSLQGRGGSAGFRFTLYAVLSVVVMFLDQRQGWLERARYVLQAASYPLQLAVSSPTTAWRWLQESFATREALESENNRLRDHQKLIELRSMRYEALEHENAELRGLKDALPPAADRWLPAEVVNYRTKETDNHRAVLNRGTSNGVFRGQAVLDEKGLLGQTIHVGPWSSEVILITDPEHEVPVQIARNGARTVAVGSGDPTSLRLPYLSANADVKIGDLLVTSGLGGVFPAGYPVARVTEIHRDAVDPLGRFRAATLGRIDVDREVMLVWFRADHPSAPGGTTIADAKTGNPAIQPQKAPAKGRETVLPSSVAPPARGASPSSTPPVSTEPPAAPATTPSAKPRSAATSPGTAPPAPNTVKSKPTPSDVPSAAPADGTTSSAPTVSRPRKPATPPPAETTPSVSGPAAAESATPPPAQAPVPQEQQ
jgi:rod shape-determining protein MreC